MGLHISTERTLDAALRGRASENPNKVWLRHNDEVHTFADAAEAVRSFANGMQSLGVKRGDRVAILLDNSPTYVFAAMAVMQVGGIFVPVNTAYSGRFLAHVLNDAASDLLISEEAFAEAIDEIAHEVPQLRCVVWTDVIHATPGVDNVDLETLRTAAPADGSVTTVAAAPSAIIYTSGTTGLSKGAVMSHNYWFDSVLSLTEARDVRPDDVFYLCSPLFHAGSWLTTIFSGLMLGLPVGMDAGFTVSGFLDRIRHYGATQIITLGAMHMWLWNSPESANDADTPARVWCPSPIPDHLQQPFVTRFGLEHLWALYGQTEAMVITSTRAGRTFKPGTCGIARAQVELAIVDEQDNVLPADTPGELVVRPRSPHTLMEGYWANPEATLRVFRNLWYHTGDLARLDDDGELFFLDRKDDYLRVGGENVSSYEVETVVADHPDIREAAVFGILADSNTPGLDDELMLYALRKSGATVSEEELADYCATLLPRFAVPRHIVFAEDLPRTPTGRVQKNVLRERGVTSATWTRETRRTLR